MTDPPAVLAVRVSLRHPDGIVVERVRLCWSVQPSAGQLLRELTARSLAARRRGLRLGVDGAPREIEELLSVLGIPLS